MRLWFTLLLWCLSVGTVNAATFWATPTGTDGGSSLPIPGSAFCLSKASATADATKYVNIATGANCLAAGDTLNIRGGLGTYTTSTCNGHSCHTINTFATQTTGFASGTSSARTTVQGAPGDPRPLITANEGANGWVTMFSGSARRHWITFRNFHANMQATTGGGTDQVISLAGTNLRVEDCELDHSFNHLIFTRATDLTDSFFDIRRCFLHDFGLDGNGYSVYGMPPDSTFQDNEIYNGRGAGLSLQYGHDRNIVSGNYFHDMAMTTQPGFGNGCLGIWVTNHTGGLATGVKIYNNVFDLSTCPAGSDSEAASIDTTTGLIFSNNTVYNAKNYGVLMRPPGFFSVPIGTVVQNNLMMNSALAAIGKATATWSESFNACPTGDGSCVTSRQSLSAITDCTLPLPNFRLKTGTNPCVDHGTALSTIPAIDKDGTARPVGSQWDIGAYERTGALPPDTTPPSPPTNIIISQRVADER